MTSAGRIPPVKTDSPGAGPAREKEENWKIGDGGIKDKEEEIRGEGEEEEECRIEIQISRPSLPPLPSALRTGGGGNYFPPPSSPVPPPVGHGGDTGREGEEEL